MTRRIERAKALLRRGDMTVTEVCFAVGCTSLGSFSSRFTELVGETPSAYRARPHDHGAPIPSCVARRLTRPAPPPQPGGGTGHATVGPAHFRRASAGTAVVRGVALRVESAPAYRLQCRSTGRRLPVAERRSAGSPDRAQPSAGGARSGIPAAGGWRSAGRKSSYRATWASGPVRGEGVPGVATGRCRLSRR